MTSYVSDRIAREEGGGTSEWADIIAWGKREGMLNLGQGFPDFVPEDTLAILKEGVADALDVNALNQYSHQNGLIGLRQAISDAHKVFYKQKVDPNGEICVMPSGTNGIFATVQAFCNPGDEVILFEPFFPWYAPTIRLAGAVPRFIQLKSPKFRIERADCEAVFSAKTKLCIINTPHNPTGRIFDADELKVISDLCQQHDVLCLSDEVYEGCVFPDSGGHRSISGVPEMVDRTLTLHSASKLLGVTGWRVGWAIGPAPLVNAVSTAHSYMRSVSGTHCSAFTVQHF